MIAGTVKGCGENNGKDRWQVSFGQLDAQFRLGSTLFHLCLRGGTVRCIYAAGCIRRNLYSAFLRLHWDISHG